MNRIAVVTLAAVLAAAAGVVVGAAGSGPVGATPAYAFAEQPPPDLPTTAPTPRPTARRRRRLPRKRPACPTTVRRTFAPKVVSMPGVVRRAVVVTPPRVHRVPGAPPLTSAGKWQVAWDRKWPIRPGARHGNVLLNAHVWPDGSALGNAMLAELRVGDRIVVRGVTRTLCYRVTGQIQVSPRQALRPLLQDVRSASAGHRRLLRPAPRSRCVGEADDLVRRAAGLTSVSRGAARPSSPRPRAAARRSRRSRCGRRGSRRSGAASTRASTPGRLR